MLDPSQYLRMQNLFGAGQMQAPQPDAGLTTPPLMGQTPPTPFDNVSFTPPQSNSVPASTPEYVKPPADVSDDMITRMSKMYQPETAATDRFTKALDAYPKRSENEPSVLRRIGGALMAVGGSLPQGRGMNFYKANPQAIAQGVSFMDKPFEDKLEDWKNTIGPIEQGANLERYRNVNERAMAYQSVSAQLKDEAQKHKEANDAVNAQIKQSRADVYAFKAMHPGLKFDFSGPTVKVADPISGHVDDLGIPTGHMGELDKLNLQQDFSMARIGAQGQNAQDLEDTRQKGRVDLQNMKGWDTREINDPDNPGQKISVRVNLDTGEVKRLQLDGKQVVGGGRKGGAGGSEKPETPTQTRVRQFNTARELYNTRPDLRPFIRLGQPGANDFEVIPPKDSSFFGIASHSGPTQALYEEARNKIYGNTLPAPVASHSTPTGGEALIPRNGPDIGKNPPPRGNNSTETGTKSPKDPRYKTIKIPQDRVLIVDKEGNPAGSIPDTPEQRTLAAKKFTVVD